MGKIEIRPAVMQDLPDILALYGVLDRELVAMQPDFFCAAPRSEQETAAALADTNAAFLLAVQDGITAGFALVEYAGWTPAFSCVLPHRYARLSDIVVLPDLRGQGIGSALLGAAKRWARDRRLEYLELNVLAQNTAAMALYESHDFVDATHTMRCML